MNTDFLTYQKSLHPVRNKMIFSDTIKQFVSEEDPKSFLSHLIMWTGLGVKNTDQVATWIRKSAEQCKKLGFQKVGDTLARHADHEADHHLMLIEDVKFLTDHFNNQYDTQIDPDEIINKPPISATEEYISIHEEAFSGESPYTQIAIEFEMEQLSVSVGPRLMENVKWVLGEEIVKKGMTFIDHHAELDIGHTVFNAKLMTMCFENHRDTLNPMIETGKRTLQIYERFISQCSDNAKLLKGL